MDINEQRKFIFIRELNVGDVKFKVGDELRLYRGAVFYNGGMLSETWSKKLIELMKKEIKDQYYLVERSIIKNKV